MRPPGKATCPECSGRLLLRRVYRICHSLSRRRKGTNTAAGLGGPPITPGSSGISGASCSAGLPARGFQPQADLGFTQTERVAGEVWTSFRAYTAAAVGAFGAVCVNPQHLVAAQTGAAIGAFLRQARFWFAGLGCRWSAWGCFGFRMARLTARPARSGFVRHIFPQVVLPQHLNRTCSGTVKRCPAFFLGQQAQPVAGQPDTAARFCPDSRQQCAACKYKNGARSMPRSSAPFARRSKMRALHFVITAFFHMVCFAQGCARRVPIGDLRCGGGGRLFISCVSPLFIHSYTLISSKDSSGSSASSGRAGDNLVGNDYTGPRRFLGGQNRLLSGQDWACEDQVTRVGYHAIGGAQAAVVRLVIAQHNLAHIHKAEVIATQGAQHRRDLVGGRQDAAEIDAHLEGGAHLCDIIVGIRHIQEERLDFAFVKSLQNIAAA